MIITVGLAMLAVTFACGLRAAGAVATLVLGGALVREARTNALRVLGQCVLAWSIFAALGVVAIYASA
ncbi:hypothetical protein EAH89_25480 [Roseomonas nepalensis]|uniref:Uncharacterized protein n=1 Tax=Muricoccus nepalensis TaxID=1854500 RepID=A0A502F9E1_9PROT|nr:hypothetical protein EAH89_25480 [Roseomonas nepalensis]